MARALAPSGVPSPICRIEVERAAISPSRDVFPQELSHLNRPNFLEVDVLLVIRDAIFWDVSRGFLRFYQRADALVIVELLRSRVLLLLSEHQLCIEQEAALLGQVSDGPLDREAAKPPEQAPLLASSSEGDDGIHMFLSIASRPRSTHRRQFDVGLRSDTCFASTLLPLRAPRQFAPPFTPGDSGALSTLHSGGMSSNA